MASATQTRRQGLTSDKGIKAPVAAATTANITLSGEQTIDGVAVLASNAAGVPDRVLVKNQTSAIDNGVYDVSTGSWTRSLDSNGSQDLVTGTGYYVIGGSINAGQFWSVSSTGSIIPGISAITFAQSLTFSASTILSNLAASNGSSLIGGGGQVVSSIAALRSLLKTSASKYAFTTGYYSAGDGGSGAYWYDSSDTTSSDNGGTIIVATDGGRWKLWHDKSVSLKQFGVKFDNSTDNSTTLQAAFTAMGATGGELYCPSSSTRALFGTGIAVPTAVSLRGEGKFESFLRYTGTGTAFAADGTSNNTIQFSDLTIDVTGNNAVVLDASRLISCTFRSVRFRGLTGTGQRAVYANITNTSWTSYFNVFIDCTFDGAFADAVYLNSSVAQYANRWRFISPTFLSNVNSFNLVSVQGIQVIAPYFNEHTGVAITLGAGVVRPQFSCITQETNSGGSLWSVNAACNRLEVFGVKVFAGTIGIGSGMGLRAMYMADWDTGIQFSGSTTATAISTLSVSDETGLVQTGVKSLGGIGTANVSISGWAGKSSTVTYSASMTIDASLGRDFTITATNGTAFTINAPTNPTTGQRITIMIRNTSGGVLGAVTWNAVFKLAAWTSPANSFSRSIDFKYDGTNWVEVGRTSVDVAN